MYTTTLDGCFFIEVEIGSGVIHDSLICVRVCWGLVARSWLLPGVGYKFLHILRPTIGGQRLFRPQGRFKCCPIW